MNSLEINRSMIINELTSIKPNEEKFNILMEIYNKALEQVSNELIEIKNEYNRIYGYDIINNITSRIKTPKSIINKMKKKKYELNYKELVDNINDIAGVRVICPLKDNINTVVSTINKLPNLKVIDVKDYIKKPKSSGYASFHLIVETPVEIQEILVPIKVEIQIRTMAMDFWATNEHKLKYKTDQKLSKIDSEKLKIYAKIINKIDDEMTKIYQKQIRMREVNCLS